MLDKLPAPVRHGIIVFFGTFVSFFLEKIIAGSGVTQLDWAATALGALDISAVATATALFALYITPLTRQYGIGKDK